MGLSIRASMQLKLLDLIMTVILRAKYILLFGPFFDMVEFAQSLVLLYFFSSLGVFTARQELFLLVQGC